MFETCGMNDGSYARRYGEVLGRLGAEPSAVQLAEGSLTLVSADDWMEDAFPPAMIPLYTEPARNTVGVWKHWLRLSLVEMEHARTVLEGGNLAEVEKRLESARHFFDSAVKKRKLAADFMVGADGQIGPAGEGQVQIP